MKTHFLQSLRTRMHLAAADTRGVTLVEMIIVVGIVAVVSTVLLFNYSNFNTAVSLRNLAQETALASRKAQTYATSIQSIGSGTSDLFPGYGISFSADAASVGNYPNAKKFVIFADIPDASSTELYGDGRYRAGASCGSPAYNSECLEMFTIKSGDRVVLVCYDTTCFDDGDNARIDVSFRRPSPDARFCLVQAGSCTSLTASYVAVTIESAKGARRTVKIWNTGQIGVQ